MFRRWLSLLVLLGCGGKRAAEPRPPAPAVTLAGSDAALAVAARDGGACTGTTAEDVTFAAADGLVVHAHAVRPCGATTVVVLAHQMCRDHGEWSAPGHDWVGALAAQGVATLAIDLRGHGNSTEWPGGGHHDLCKETGDAAARQLYTGMVSDVTAAVAYARAHLDARTVSLVGASIGANSALVTFAADPRLAMVVALSPGLDYRGIKTTAALAGTADRAVWLEAARDDARSADAVARLGAANPRLATRIWPSGGHGNNLIDAHPDELTRIVAALAAH